MNEILLNLLTELEIAQLKSRLRSPTNVYTKNLSNLPYMN